MMKHRRAPPPQATRLDDAVLAEHFRFLRMLDHQLQNAVSVFDDTTGGSSAEPWESSGGGGGDNNMIMTTTTTMMMMKVARRRSERRQQPTSSSSTPSGATGVGRRRWVHVR